ncbi:MAG: hypothetical protein KA004_14560 [Verrucomicrobiales bacterium]|nr:hypothetical protein [Verrucomicrobiales bacterium]
MDRLRCGVVVTDAFASHLHAWWLAEQHRHASKIPSLDYVHCREGLRAGEDWMTFSWVTPARFPESEMFDVGGVRLHLSRRTQQGLKWRCLDAKNGQVMVRGGG